MPFLFYCSGISSSKSLNLSSFSLSSKSPKSKSISSSFEGSLGSFLDFSRGVNLRLDLSSGSYKSSSESSIDLFYLI